MTHRSNPKNSHENREFSARQPCICSARRTRRHGNQSSLARRHHALTAEAGDLEAPLRELVEAFDPGRPGRQQRLAHHRFGQTHHRSSNPLMGRRSMRTRTCRAGTPACPQTRYRPRDLPLPHPPRRRARDRRPTTPAPVKEPHRHCSGQPLRRLASPDQPTRTRHTPQRRPRKDLPRMAPCRLTNHRSIGSGPGR